MQPTNRKDRHRQNQETSGAKNAATLKTQNQIASLVALALIALVFTLLAFRVIDPILAIILTVMVGVVVNLGRRWLFRR